MSSPHHWIVELTAQYLVLVWGVAVLAACLGSVVAPLVARLCAQLQVDFGQGSPHLDSD